MANLEQALMKRDWENDDDGLRGVLHSAHQKATAPGARHREHMLQFTSSVTRKREPGLLRALHSTPVRSLG